MLPLLLTTTRAPAGTELQPGEHLLQVLLLDDPHQHHHRFADRHVTRRNNANKYEGSDSGVKAHGGGGVRGVVGGRVLTAEAEGGEAQVGQRSLDVGEEEGEGEATALVLAAAETILRVTGGNA